MRTVQMTLDDDLVDALDSIAKQMKITRSAFTRAALREAIDNMKTKVLEEKHRKGYEMVPVATHEFSVWENEQDWGE